MFKKAGSIICLLLVCICAVSFADVAIDGRTFPDTNFRTYVKENFDTDKNGILSDAEISAITVIMCTQKNISSLKGIEHFPELKELEVYGNQLTSVDVSKNTKLTYLHLQWNNLSSLDVQKNKLLKNLYCDDNKLTSLKLGKQKSLDNFSCRNNKLTSLNISNCPKLVTLVSSGEPGFFEPDGRNMFGWWTPRNTDSWPDTCIFVDKDLKLITSTTVKKVTSITLNKTKATLKAGKTLKLKAKEILPADATDKTVTWKSSNTKVATVDQNGKVKAVGKGTCTITCTAKDGSKVKAKCKITVK